MQMTRDFAYYVFNAKTYSWCHSKARVYFRNLNRGKFIVYTANKQSKIQRVAIETFHNTLIIWDSYTIEWKTNAKGNLEQS